MPIRAAAPPCDQAVTARLRHIMPQAYLSSHDSTLTANDGTQYTLEHHRPLTHMELEQYASSLSAHSNSPQALLDADEQDYFNTNSPPVLNLSPNLSPSSEVTQRHSPVYDLRESTRRRSYQGICTCATIKTRHVINFIV